MEVAGSSVGAVSRGGVTYDMTQSSNSQSISAAICKCQIEFAANYS